MKIKKKHKNIFTGKKEDRTYCVRQKKKESIRICLVGYVTDKHIDLIVKDNFEDFSKKMKKLVAWKGIKSWKK